MHYHHVMSSNGWQKSKCSPCQGNSKAIYTHPAKAGEKVVIYKISKVFRYLKNGKQISGGSIDHLQHQHFI